MRKEFIIEGYSLDAIKFYLSRLEDATNHISVREHAYKIICKVTNLQWSSNPDEKYFKVAAASAVELIQNLNDWKR